MGRGGNTTKHCCDTGMALLAQPKLKQKSPSTADGSNSPTVFSDNK
jgi:hypothetical protein